MDCRQVQPRITDYSVGLLRAREVEQVEGHLAACAACAREWRKLQAVLNLVERCGSREPPLYLWNGVYNRITADAKTAPAAPGWWERLLGVRRIVSHLPFTVYTDVGVDIGIIHQPSVRLQPHLLRTTGQEIAPGPTAPSAVAAQKHAMLSGFEPFADEVGLEAYARLVNDPDVNSHIR